jgi:hypothetical protein
MKQSLLALIAAMFLSTLLSAQENPSAPLYPAPGDPADAQARQENSVEQNSQMPVFRVNVYGRTTRAVNYRHRGSSTTLDLKGTSLMPEISGKARVDGKAGRLAISVELSHMEAARKFGGEYLTYVLWAVTPEGRG